MARTNSAAPRRRTSRALSWKARSTGTTETARGSRSSVATPMAPRPGPNGYYDSTNTHVLSYSHLSLGTPVARVKRTAAGVELEYQFHGLANHTLAAISSAGVTNAAFSYSPFGEIIEAIDAGGTSGAAAHHRRFNDKQNDEISELIYYGARYYERVSMAWTQSDPLFRFSPERAWDSPRLGSLHSFSLNNPLKYVDPDGLSPCEIDPAICAGDETPWTTQEGEWKPMDSRGAYLVGAMVGIAFPEVGFVLAMSQASNENEIVVPIIAFALTIPKRHPRRPRAVPARVVGEAVISIRQITTRLCGGREPSKTRRRIQLGPLELTERCGARSTAWAGSRNNCSQDPRGWWHCYPRSREDPWRNH